MNITVIKITPEALIPSSTSLITPQLNLPEKGLLKIPNRKSNKEEHIDEDIYNMKMINWLSHP